MKIQTFSILAGTEACNARCPFCVSAMTHAGGIELKETPINWRNFRKACEFANRTDVTTVMITGKGEPTLFPHQIHSYMKEMEPYKFPLIEVQTNGLVIMEKWDTPFGQIVPGLIHPRKLTMEEHLHAWYDLGMTTICISNVGYDMELNHKIYTPHLKSYIDLPLLIDRLHKIGFMVRLTTVLIDGGIDGGNKLDKLIDFAKKHKVKQLSICPVNKPEAENSRNPEVFGWVGENHIKEHQLKSIKTYCELNGKVLNYLAHGAVVYDVHGQNLCFRNCLTVDPKSEQLRNLIFYPNGDLRTDWEHGGAVLL